jgi:Xaa-Pro aminopeptidase
MKTIENCRRYLGDHDLDALILLRSDPFMGEYIAPSDAILEHVTGFTGSFGFCVITQKTAGLFVDGRYTLQASAEVAGKNINVFHYQKMPFENFLKSDLPLRVGVDTRCITKNQFTVWQKKIHPHALVPLADSYINELWPNRPCSEFNKVVHHPLIYSGKTTLEKLSDLNLKLETALFLCHPESICWLLNIRGDDVAYTPLVHAYAFVTQDHVHFFCDLRKTQGLKFDSFVSVHDIGDLLVISKDLLKDVQVLQYDPDQISQDLYMAFSRFHWAMEESVDPCLLSKAIKNSQEQEGFRSCHHEDGIAVYESLKEIYARDEISEMEIDDILLKNRQRSTNFQTPSFSTIAGINENGAIVHYRAIPAKNKTATKKDGALILIDSGGQYLTGTTDITRTIWFGDMPPPIDMQRHYTLVLKGHIALGRIHFPVGTTGPQLDAIARQFLWSSGLDYDHGTGHGVGSYLSVHEGPQRIGKASIKPTALQIGMVLSNEPGVYLEGKYGIRIENLVLVVASIYPGFLTFETLTKVPYDDALILWDLLSEDEKSWIESLVPFSKHIS